MTLCFEFFEEALGGRGGLDGVTAFAAGREFIPLWTGVHFLT